MANKVHLVKSSMLPWRDTCTVQVEQFIACNELHPHWTVLFFLLIDPITHWAHNAVWCVWCFLLPICHFGLASSLLMLTGFLGSLQLFLLIPLFFLCFSCCFPFLLLLCFPDLLHLRLLQELHLLTGEVFGKACCFSGCLFYLLSFWYLQHILQQPTTVAWRKACVLKYWHDVEQSWSCGTSSSICYVG